MESPSEGGFPSPPGGKEHPPRPTRPSRPSSSSEAVLARASSVSMSPAVKRAEKHKNTTDNTTPFRMYKRLLGALMDLMGADEIAVARVEEALANSQRLKARSNRPTITLREARALQEVVDLILPMLQTEDDAISAPYDELGCLEESR